MNDTEIVKRLARMHLDAAHRLYQLRIEGRLTIEEVSEMTRISVQRLEMIEEGDTTDLEEIARLCAAYGVSFEITPDFQPVLTKCGILPIVTVDAKYLPAAASTSNQLGNLGQALATARSTAIEESNHNLISRFAHAS